MHSSTWQKLIDGMPTQAVLPFLHTLEFTPESFVSWLACSTVLR